MSILALTESSSLLTVGTKGVCNSNASYILCKLIRSSSSSLLAAYWICELFIFSNFIQGVISRFLHAVALLWIYLYLSHIQQYYLKTARLLVLMHHRKFTKCLFAVIHTPEYNYCVLIFSLHDRVEEGMYNNFVPVEVRQTVWKSRYMQNTPVLFPCC